ncbi:MAG TPA: hypothetical protein VHX38_03665 [Pseudonocardiaceae bacterium]|nr:hypothetical protein [Pseudonocardiaceae bacterium]
MSDEQQQPDSTEAAASGEFVESAQEQPIVAMRDLSAGQPGAGAVGAAEADVDPDLELLPLPNSRQWTAGGLLLVLAAATVVAALLLPLYQLVSQPSIVDRNGSGGLLTAFTFQVTPWGLTQPLEFGSSEFNLIQVLVGPTPKWGIPLAVIAALLAVSGGALIWRRAAWTAYAVLGSVALFTGCLVAMGTYLFSAIQGYAVIGNGVHGVLGPSFWVLILALVLALVGAYISYRNQPRRAAQPLERVEPDTPALGFPLPDSQQGGIGN